MGKDREASIPPTNLTSTKTSNSILYRLKNVEGQENCRGKVMCRGIFAPRRTSPSAIWRHCTSVVSRICPSEPLTASILMSCRSIDLTGLDESSIEMYPANSPSIEQMLVAISPWIVNLWTIVVSPLMLSLVIEKGVGTSVIQDCRLKL